MPQTPTSEDELSDMPELVTDSEEEASSEEPQDWLPRPYRKPCEPLLPELSVHTECPSIERTAFSVPWGHYEYVRLPFGLIPSPAPP